MYAARGEQITDTVVLTPEFRVSFPYVLTGQEQTRDDGKKVTKFSVAMLFPKGADLSLLVAMVEKCIAEKFGPDKAKWPRLRLPFRDQADKADKWKGYEPGAWYLTATSNDRPGLVGPESTADGKPRRITEPAEFYAGCYAVATVNAFYYKTKGNEGIGIGLRNIQKTRDGEPLGNRTSPETDFKPLQAPTPGGVLGAMSGATPPSAAPNALQDIFGGMK